MRRVMFSRCPTQPQQTRTPIPKTPRLTPRWQSQVAGGECAVPISVQYFPSAGRTDLSSRRVCV